MNLILSVTEGTYAYHSEAAAACSFEHRVLCDLEQLQNAEDIGGDLPEFKWGWFAIEDRAATLEHCDPGGHVFSQNLVFRYFQCDMLLFLAVF